MLPDGSKKRWYVFTCIDRVSKIAYVWLSERKTQQMGKMFLDRVITFYPYRINYILTDNGGEFSFKFMRKEKRPKNRLHPFDQACKDNKIQHRTIRFNHSWTNGMVERFNQKVKTNVIRRYLFENVKELNDKLIHYVNRYNFELKLQQLNGKTPYEYLVDRFNNKLTKRPQRIVN